MTPTTRYTCPLSDCGWHYDAPQPDSIDAATAAPDPHAATPAQAIESMGYHLSQRHAFQVNWIVGLHLDTHPLAEWVREVQRLKGLLAAATAPTSTTEEAPC